MRIIINSKYKISHGASIADPTVLVGGQSGPPILDLYPRNQTWLLPFGTIWCQPKVVLRAHILPNEKWGFPGGAVVGNLPANAGDTGSSPGLGRSHMPRSNSAREPQLLSLRVWSLCSATREAATVRGPRTAMKSGPHLPQLEKALAQKRRPNTAINKQTNK